MAQDIFDTTPEDLRASMLVATSTDPEAHAKVVNLANKLQLPPELVARNPQWAQHQSDLMLDAEKLTKDYPGTSKFLSDPNRAAVSRDELIQHMAMEDTLRSAELLEPGLFGKDVRDAIAKQLRDKGHKIEIVDGSRPASEWLPSLDFTAGENVPDVIPGEVQAFQGVGGMGIPNPAQDTQDEQSQKMDQKAVQLYKTPQGFWERMITGATNLEPVPFAGAGKELVDVYALTQLANRVKDGTADDNDWIELLKYDNEIRRGTDFGGKVAAVLVNLPAFAGEIAATGGLYTAGSQGARKAGLYAAKKILNKSAREVAESAVLRGVGKTAGWVAGSAVQSTVGMPHRVAVDAMQRMVPQLSTMSVNEQGELEKLVLDSEDGFASAIGKAIFNQSIEVGTESAGAFIGKVTGLEALKSAVVTKWFKVNPTKGWSQFSALLRKAKWDGVLEEFGEERLGEILRAVTGLEQMKLDPEQYAVELVSFAALPMAGAAVYGPGMVRQSRQLAERAQTQVDFFRDLGAQASESKTRTRVPGMLGTLGDLAAQNGPVERVFAPIAVWDQYFASKGLDPRQVAQETLGEAESYDKAREAGHDLEIPIGAYTEKLAPTEHNEPLSQYLRLGAADAPNVVEMQAGLQATQASVEEMLKLNQDYTALSTEKQTLAEEMTTLQEQVNTLQSQAEQRTARMQEIQSQLQTQAPQALQEILSGNAPAAGELQGLAQEYQSLAQQDQQAQQASARINAITARQGEIDKEISRIEKRNAQARQSAPGQAPEVVDMANEVYTQLMATKNTSEGVARAHSNMFARMAYIMANRSGMSLQQFKDRFVTQIIGKGNAAPAGVTMSQEEQQRDADYLAAVEASDMEEAQRLVIEAAKAAGYDLAHRGNSPEESQNIVLFAGIDEMESGLRGYGESRYVASRSDLQDIQSATELMEWVRKNYGEEYANELNPSNIIDSAQAWDDQQFVSDVWQAMEAGDIPMVAGFVTSDGAVVFPGFNKAKSADPVTRDADGNVIPLSERFDSEQNSILYQREPTENVLAEAPIITLHDLIGRAVFPIIADLTSAGKMYTGIDSTQIAVPIYTQGGPKFPLLPENQQAGVAWASQGTHIATSKAKLAGQSVLGVVVAMSQEAHKSNATVINAILATVQAYVGAGRMSDEQVAALDDLIRTQGPIAEKKAMDEAQSELAKAQSKLKKAKTPKDIAAANKAMTEAQAQVADANPGDKSLSKWPGFKNAQEASEFIDRNKTTFGQRQRLADVIALKQAEDLGTPNVDAILNELRDKDYNNMEWGDSIMVIEFDKNDSLVRLGTDGTKEHMSYEWGIRGKVVGKLARPVNYTLIWDDFFKERRAQHSKFMEAARKEAARLKKDFLNLTKEEMSKIKKTLEEKQQIKPALEEGDRRSFELKKPVQVITQEIADRIPQTPHTSIKSPKHAQLVNAFLNNEWMSTDVAVNKGGLGPATFINALAADPNKVLLDEYDLKSIAKAKKAQGLRIFQLGVARDIPGKPKENTSKVFFGVKNGDPASAYGLDPAAHGFGPNEKMLTLVLNGEGNAPGMTPAILIKALEEGVTSLDCYAVPSKKYPDGFLPSLYEQFGFEVTGTIPFAKEYHSATKLADMEKLWKDSGWDESLGYPPIVLMKWKGTDEQRPRLKEHYLREGTTSFLPGGNPSTNASAARDIRHDVGATDGQAGNGPDSGRTAGNEGTSVRLSDSSRKLANAVAELQELSPLELQNLGLLTASQVEDALRKAEDKPVFPEVTLNQTAAPAGMSAKEIAQWAAEHSIEEVRQKLKDFRLTPTDTMLQMLGSFPEYLKPVVDFVMAQRQKLVDGNISAREVAKAYFITLSSIGADAINVETIRKKAEAIGMEFNPDPMFLSKGSKGQDRMRPEELAAWWFSTDMGQRALNAIEKGEVDREAWEQGLAIRDAFGRNDAREKQTKSGSYVPGMLGEKRNKKNLNDILEITKLINQTKGDSDKLEKVLNGIQGVGNGKKGFVGHMLGMGDVATIDAVEMNVWLTGKGDTTRADEEMKKRVALAKKGGTNVPDFYERIRSRIAEIHKKTKDRTGIPDDVAAHIVHHWIWDAAKGAQTTHAGVYEAMRFYQNENNARGSISFNPAQRGAPRREFTIRMLSSANASTFMHEAAHFYLEVFNDLASAPDAPQALREDWDRISKWLGLQAGVPVTTDQHETFARGFERYLMEGKAPAEEVRGFFASMRAWLVRIYRDLMNLNVDISDEIRGVFDRMVATDVEIEAAQAREKVEPMFGSKPASMDDAAWERYRKAVEQASLEARERLQAELEREMLQANSDQRKAEIARVTETVRAELAATREHIALAILRSGKMPDDQPIPEPLMPMKLDRDSLLSAGLDKDTMNALRKLGVYRVEDGVSVDVAAEVLGFGSADELVQALVTTPSFDKAVKEETKRRVDASHPSMMEDSEELKRAASNAVRNKYRDNVIAIEVEELQRLIRADKQAAGRVADLAPAPLGAIARRILRSGPEQANAARILLDNSKVTIDFIKQIAAKAAQEQLQGMKLRDIRPSLYLAAARAAGARASRLAAAGDFQGALGQKEAELLNHILYRESREMQKVAQKQQRYLLRMTEDAARERLGKANPSYREQVDGILERFNFQPIPLSQVDRRTRLADWITAQEAKGLTVDIDPTVRDEAFQKDFREMTAIELTAVWEAVKQIDHLAKTTTRLLTLQDEREFRAVVQELVAQITANTKAKPRGFGSKTAGEKVAEGWDSFFAAHRKLASLIREMDGFVDAGPVYKAIMAPINDAGDNEAVETEKATEAIQKLFTVFEKDELKRMTRKQVVRGATKNFNLSREDVLSIALNWGNEDNRQKLVDGYNGLTEQDVIAILDTMTEKEWKFVQSVWDYIDSFWPRIRDKQERVYGIPPDKIEPTPVVTKFGVFKGGYYPLKYAGARAEGESDADAAKMMMRGAVTSSTTRRGHTKERVAGVERPVRLDLGVLTEHVTQVVHDLTHHEMLVDVNRILRNRSVMEAIEEHYGEPVYRQLRKALEAIAVGNTNSEDRFTRALGHIRTGASVAGLGFNLMTSMLQAFGLTNAIPRVGAINMAKAVGRWIGSRSDMEDSIAWIYERSDMMRLRGKTMNRELNEIRNTVDPKFQTALMDSYFYLIQKGQMLADVPTWLGAYHKATDAKHSEEEAIRIADQTVIDTQGGGMVKDLANVQRGGPLLKMWTTFYSYFNALWNLNVETVKRTNFKSPTDMGRMMVDLLILNSLPVAIQYALVTAMRGGSGDDEEWYKALAKQQMSYLLAQLVFVRELGGIMDGRNYEGPAGGRFFAESYKLAKQVEQGELDRGFWASANKVGGILFHYPAVQAQRTVEGMKSLWEGKTSNPAVLIVGPSREER